MEAVAIVGVGLIGASFGLALRQAGFSGPIIGVSSPKAIEAGLAVGAISEEMTLEKAAKTADLIYLAQTIDRILETLPLLAGALGPDCLVTDAGSTKKAIVEKATALLGPRTFLGGHPMAGKEQRGAAAAEATLFSNRPYVLTPVSEMTPRMCEFRNWLLRMQARVVVMSSTEHDTVVALTSHLPQLLSTAISVTLAETENFRLLEVFGPGLLDMTRLAMSSAEVWQSVLDTNREDILQALLQFTRQLGTLTAKIQSRADVDYLFAVARSFALRLRSES